MELHTIAELFPVPSERTALEAAAKQKKNADAKAAERAAAEAQAAAAAEAAAAAAAAQAEAPPAAPAAAAAPLIGPPGQTHVPASMLVTTLSTLSICKPSHKSPEHLQKLSTVSEQHLTDCPDRPSASASRLAMQKALIRLTCLHAMQRPRELQSLQQLLRKRRPHHLRQQHFQGPLPRWTPRHTWGTKGVLSRRHLAAAATPSRPGAPHRRPQVLSN